MDELATKIESILRGAGLNDRPDEYDSDIHGWRCEHPDRYGRCNHLQDLVAELQTMLEQHEQ